MIETKKDALQIIESAILYEKDDARKNDMIDCLNYLQQQPEERPNIEDKIIEIISELGFTYSSIASAITKLGELQDES